MSEWTVLPSHQDRSVNFTHPAPKGGIFEARFVQRQPEYIAVYLSAQAGCKQACRMCHLTQTGQTNDEDASLEEIAVQAEKVLQYYDTLPDTIRYHVKYINFNFMARGEPLMSKTVLYEYPMIHDILKEQAKARGLDYQINISTIMPTKTAGYRLEDIFWLENTYLYYSLYSIDNDFRRRWLPKAISAHIGLARLAQWSRVCMRTSVIHYALIKDQNDRQQDCELLLDILDRHLFYGDVRVNLVQYNPFSSDQGEETNLTDMQRYFDLMRDHVKQDSKIVKRVGEDVYASCGVFAPAL